MQSKILSLETPANALDHSNQADSSTKNDNKKMIRVQNASGGEDFLTPALPFPPITSVTLFPDEVLSAAFQSLDLETFKLFIYLYHRVQKCENPGRACDRSLGEDLENRLDLARENLINSFIVLREMGWIQGFVFSIVRNEYAEYWWSMCLLTPDGRNYGWSYGYPIEEDAYSTIDNRNHNGCYSYGSYFLVIGTERRPDPPDPPTKNGRIYNSHFKKMRLKVLERDDNKCTQCGSEDNLHIHHLTYDNEGNELLEDLVTLCSSCHSKVRR